MQEQLDKLKRKETVYNPRQGLMAGKESKEETSPSQSKDTKNEIEYWQIVGCQKPPVKEELEQNLKVTDNKRPTH